MYFYFTLSLHDCLSLLERFAPGRLSRKSIVLHIIWHISSSRSHLGKLMSFTAACVSKPTCQGGRVVQSEEIIVQESSSLKTIWPLINYLVGRRFTDLSETNCWRENEILQRVSSWITLQVNFEKDLLRNNLQRKKNHFKLVYCNFFHEFSQKYSVSTSLNPPSW